MRAIGSSDLTLSLSKGVAAAGRRPDAELAAVPTLFDRGGRFAGEGLAHTVAIMWVGLGEVAELVLDDLRRHAGHGPGDVVVQPLALGRAQQAVEISRLGVVVVANPMIIAVGSAGDLQRRFLDRPILDRPAEAIGLIVTAPP